MNDKTGSSLCPKCGAAIPAEASQGLCPKCALAAVAAPTETGADQAWPAGVPSMEAVQAAFPQLEIVELIGSGGMGAVFKARQPRLDRFVALKVLAPSLAASPAFAERFNREARVLARLNHPGIVNVFDFGHVEPGDGRSVVAQASSLPAKTETPPKPAAPLCFLLMEYVDGVNLRQAMEAGRFTPTQALALVPKICEALQFAHDEGILHRDIKPENILLDTRGRLKIADFGIAKLVGEPTSHTRLTATGAAIGTPQYMAPEQLEHPEDVDQRADIYSLGVVFYEMLTGELPIGRFAAPSAKAPVDPRVDEVVFRALEKERERRYGSAGEVKTSVEHLTQSPAASPPAAPVFDPTKDFILCPPQLPRMAQAIIVYALVAAPMLWVLDLFALAPLPDHPAVGFVQVMVNLFVSVGVFPLLVVLWIGGWKLRGLRRSAVTWLKTSIWLRFAGGLLAALGQVWVEVLGAQLLPDAPSPRPPLSEGLYVAMALAALAFEISALVWLHRHTALLKSLSQTPPSGGAVHGMPAREPAGGRSPVGLGKAIASAGFGAPAWLSAMGLLVLGVRVAVVAAVNRNVRFGPGFGLEEMGMQLGLVFGLLVLTGIAGVVLGGMALSERGSTTGQGSGHWLALVGITGLPTLLLQLLFIALVAVPLPLISPGSEHLVVPLAMSCGPVAGIAAGLMLARLVHRRTVGPMGADAEGARPALLPYGALAWVIGIPLVILLAMALVKAPRGPLAGAEAGATLRPYPNQAPPVSPEAFNGQVEVPAGNPDRTVAVDALAPPRENFIVLATVLSNNVPVSGRELRAKLWPPDSLKPSLYTIRWQAITEPAVAPWEIVVEERATGTIAARLRPEGLPPLDWKGAAQAAKAGVRNVTREARAFEIARALQEVGGDNAGAADWSVRLQLQSQPFQPSAAPRGIKADFVLPANQVAVFEVVTRTNQQLVPVPGLGTHVVNGSSEACQGTFLWHDDPDDLDSLTALPRWSFGLVVDGNRSVATGLGVPTPPANYAGSLSLWTRLEPDAERIEGLDDQDASHPAYGLRVRTQAFPSTPGVRYQGAGFGTNWLAEAAARLAEPAE